MNMKTITGRRSEILLAERSASIIDSVISAGAGAALLSVTLLRGTPAEVIIPVADALVVIVLALVMIKQPYQMLRGAMREVTGEAVDDGLSAKTRERIERTIQGVPCKLLAVAVTKLGRTHFVLIYVRPDDSVVAEDLDQFRSAVPSQFHDRAQRHPADRRLQRPRLRQRSQHRGLRRRRPLRQLRARRPQLAHRQYFLKFQYLFRV